MAAQDFLMSCLVTAPAFGEAPERFEKLGYGQPTTDPLVFSKDGRTFLGGLGVADFEGAPHLTTPNGCLVYVHGNDGAGVAQELQRYIDALIPGATANRYGSDFYWFVWVDEENPITIFVAPKANGTYAGYVLLMVVRGHMPDPAA